MTVKELIEELQKLPFYDQVWIRRYDSGRTSFIDIKAIDRGIANTGPAVMIEIDTTIY